MVMQILGAIALLAFAFAMTWIIANYFESRRIAAVEVRYYENRESLCDEGFLKALPDCKTPQFHLAARRAMARLCGTTADMIHPGDDMRQLLNLQFDCGFIQDFVFFIEDEADIALDMNKMPSPENINFAMYVSLLATANNVAETKQFFH